ncbi:hypothetical protein B6I21_09305 [candidate division KSB1 bacterium 4572_119]|nr:MAG: hypothetical protein B6I21_09305 [candidate division KSB1 bacterium 4572_119]
MNQKDFYQIIATLGPAVQNQINELIHAGATGFRLNCSHLSWQELSRWLMKLENAFQNRGDAMPVWLDLQGTKTRLGKLTEPMELRQGELARFHFSYCQEDSAIPLPHQWFFNNIETGDQLLLNDGRIHLQVVQIGEQQFQAEILREGEISSFKGFMVKGKNPKFDEISDRDRSFIEQTKQLKFVGYAISYLRNENELKVFRDVVGSNPLTAKIEQEDAIKNLERIADLADSCWLCRGDLGTTANIYELYNYEKEFAKKMKHTNKLYLIAGQVLENMVNYNYPSRSEIAHLGYLIDNNFSGLVLSDETAIGKYPIQAVEFCREYFEYLVE